MNAQNAKNLAMKAMKKVNLNKLMKSEAVVEFCKSFEYPKSRGIATLLSNSEQCHKQPVSCDCLSCPSAYTSLCFDRGCLNTIEPV